MLLQDPLIAHNYVEHAHCYSALNLHLPRKIFLYAGKGHPLILLWTFVFPVMLAFLSKSSYYSRISN